MSEMVERVRAAIQAHQTAYGPDYEGMARVAMEAMVEPLPRMLEAADISAYPHTDEMAPTRFANICVMWRAMVKSALLR